MLFLPPRLFVTLALKLGRGLLLLRGPLIVALNRRIPRVVTRTAHPEASGSLLEKMVLVMRACKVSRSRTARRSTGHRMNE
jgi:hypothetical protein